MSNGIHITVIEDTWYIFEIDSVYYAGGFVGEGDRIDSGGELYDKLYTSEQEYIYNCIDLGLEP